jgi:hypothetical protein
VDSLYAKAVKEIKANARFQPVASREGFIVKQYRPVLEAYRRLTGHSHAGHPSHLIHHRISKYGPPCSSCGKPLRTRRANYCAACGACDLTAAMPGRRRSEA